MKHVPGKVKDKYEILGVIGEGAYGVVLKARKKDTNTVVAIKHFKQNPGYCSDIDVIDRELRILQSLRFENVVELIEWFRDKKRCLLVFEYVEWNMLQVLQEHPEGLPLEQVRQLSYQLFSAIYWCHTHEIIHRDIKPENLLISKNFTLKLCDFGFARFCNTQTTADYYTNYVATRWYRSPELLIGSPYGKPVDIWACGCIMAELATGQALFAGESDIDQLYRIQRCLGPLPAGYVEAMRINPKFDGLKFPLIQHLDTLERRFGHVFPTDIMHIFKNTLRLYANDRFTGEKCVQHEAFNYLNQNRFRRPHRPKTVYGSFNTSVTEIDHKPADNRLSKSYYENVDNQYHRRSPSVNINGGIDNSTDTTFATSSSVTQSIKYRSNSQLADRSSVSHRHPTKILRVQSRTHSSSSDEQHKAAIFTPRSSNDTSADDDDPNNINLRRKYLTSHQSFREQQITPSPILKFASNGVLLRSKQQHPTNILQTSSKEMDKKVKRFSLDQHQIVSNQKQTPEANIYRSSMAIASSHNVQNPNASVSFKQLREESNNELQRLRAREMNRDLVRSRTVGCHPPEERTSSRQNHHQVVPDPMDQVDVDSMVSTTYQTSRNVEQQQHNRYPWNSEQRRPVYGSDSYLLGSNGHNSSFSRPFYSPNKGDYTHTSRTAMTSHQGLNHDAIKSAKSTSKQNVASQAKTSSESSRRQHSSSLFGAYPFARTALLNVANTIIPSSHQRHQSIRLSNKKSRNQDH